MAAGPTGPYAHPGQAMDPRLGLHLPSSAGHSQSCLRFAVLLDQAQYSVRFPPILSPTASPALFRGFTP